jgi:Na+/H+ antiporter NhaD/arsenite permease-like protein
MHYPPYWTVAPFVLLLSAIALFPLAPQIAKWWESNLHRFFVAGLLATAALAYYLFVPLGGGLNFVQTWEVLSHTLFHEYVPFMMLLFALYTISGGIRLEGDLRAHPLTNSLFLATGAVLASIIGTTGAAMVLVRPLLETNSERRRVAHTVIFFIFIVCNCGGCLLPTGDPPLFLGYLRGVSFLWTLSLWPEWLFVNGLLIGIYYVYDRFWHYPHEAKADVVRDETRVRPLRFLGVWPNAALLLAVIAAVAVLDPRMTVPGTDWHPWPYLREGVLLALVGLSLATGSREVRRANNFNYSAILEVAALFFGIFITMQPALQILQAKGPDLGLATATHFFWTTGALSSVLDNAPTYVVFFETAKTLGGEPQMAGVAEPLLRAVSLGAVFMGANTYIGNGPNFMVRAIAEQSGVRMPSFFGYMVYSGLVLLPLFALTNWIFL